MYVINLANFKDFLKPASSNKSLRQDNLISLEDKFLDLNLNDKKETLYYILVARSNNTGIGGPH